MSPPSAIETEPLTHNYKSAVQANSLLGTQASPSSAALPSNLRPEQLRHIKPLKQTGILDQYESFDVTPVIGREFPKANLVEWLQSENSDSLIRDLAITSMRSFLLVTFGIWR